MDQASHHHHIFECDSGFCGIAWSDAGIARFQLPARSAEASERQLLRRLEGAAPAEPSGAVRDAVAMAKRYFAGEVVDFSATRLDLAGQSDFFRSIYDALRQIGWGQTTTYGALAKAVGAGPEAARGVGQAMARNPVPLIIPCHRVLAAGGKLGGFSAPGGQTAKTRMLELEGVNVGPGEPAQHSLPL